MTRSAFHSILIMIIVGMCLGSFAWTAARRTPAPQGCQGQLGCWLQLSDQQSSQLQSRDQGFANMSAELAQAYRSQRQHLAELFRDSNTAPERIREQAQQAVQANHALQSQVIEHVLAVRADLDPEQRTQLMGLCSRLVSHRGMGLGKGPGRGMGMGMGRGMGPGRGQHRGQPGFGAGRGSGRGCRFAQHLAMNDQQLASIQQLDPDFAQTSADLSGKVKEQYSQLAACLEDLQSTDQRIREQLEHLFESRIHLETRTVQHVLRIRAILTPEQQLMLVGLCRRCAPGEDS
jgi:uncharacterized membrane-anchored protein YhcB (DUF1043 family)